MNINFSAIDLQNLKEEIEGGDFCFVCKCHPGIWHHGHADDCPLKFVGGHKKDCLICIEESRHEI